MAPAPAAAAGRAAPAAPDAAPAAAPQITTAASTASSSAIPLPPLIPAPRPVPKSLMPGFELTRPTLDLALTDLGVYAAGFALWTAAPVRAALGPLAFLLPLACAGSVFAPAFDAYSPAISALMAATSLVAACVASAVGLLGMYLTQVSAAAAGALVLACGAVAAFLGNFVPAMWASVFTMAFVWSTLLTCAGFALSPLPLPSLPMFPASMLASLAVAQGVAVLFRCLVGPFLLGTPSHALRYALDLDDATVAMDAALGSCARMVERWSRPEEEEEEQAAKAAAEAAAAAAKAAEAAGADGAAAAGAEDTKTPVTTPTTTSPLAQYNVQAAEMQATWALAAAKVEALARRTPVLVVDRSLLLRGRQGQCAARLTRATTGLLQASQALGLALVQLGRAEGRVHDGGDEGDDAGAPRPAPPAAERAGAAARAVRGAAPELQRVLADARLNLRAGRAHALRAADAASSAAPWFRTRGAKAAAAAADAAAAAAAAAPAADVEAGTAAGPAAASSSSPLPLLPEPVPADRVVRGVDDLEGAVIAALRAEGFGRTSSPPDVLVTSLLLSANSSASFVASAALAFARRGCDGDAAARSGDRRRNTASALRHAWQAMVAGGGGGVFAPTSAGMSLGPRRSAAAAAEAHAREGRRAQRRQQRVDAAEAKAAAAAAPLVIAGGNGAATTITTGSAARPARTGGSAALETIEKIRGSGGGGKGAGGGVATAAGAAAGGGGGAGAKTVEAAAAAALGLQAYDNGHADDSDGGSNSDDDDSVSSGSDDGEADPFAAATAGRRSGFSVSSRRARSRSPSPAARQARAAERAAAEAERALGERAAQAARARARRRQAALAVAATGNAARYAVGGPDRRRGLARMAAMVSHESTKAVLRAVIAFVVVALITNTLKLPQLTFVSAFLGASFVFSGAYLGKATFVFCMRVIFIIPGMLLAWATWAATRGDANRWACWAMASALAAPFVLLARIPLLGAAFGFSSIFVVMPLMLYQLTASGTIAGATKKGLSLEVAEGLVPSFFLFAARMYGMTACGALVGLLASYCVSPVLAADKVRDSVAAAGYRLAYALLRLRVVATSGVARRRARLAIEEGEEAAAQGKGGGVNNNAADADADDGDGENKDANDSDWASHPLGPPDEIAALDAAARGVQALCEGVHLALAPMPVLAFFAGLEPAFRGPWRPDLYARVQGSFRSCATLTAAWVHASAVENRRRWSRAELLAAVAVNEHYGGHHGEPQGSGGGGGVVGGAGQPPSSAMAAASSAAAASVGAHGASPYGVTVLRLTAALAGLESGRPLMLFGLPPPLTLPPPAAVEEGKRTSKGGKKGDAAAAAAAAPPPPPKPAVAAARAQASAQRSIMMGRGVQALSSIVRLNDDVLAGVVAEHGRRPAASQQQQQQQQQAAAAGGTGARGATAAAAGAAAAAAPATPAAPAPGDLRFDWLATSHGRHALAGAVTLLHLRALVDEALEAVRELVGACDGRLLLGAEAMAGLEALGPGGWGGDGGGGFTGSALAVHAREGKKAV